MDDDSGDSGRRDEPRLSRRQSAGLAVGTVGLATGGWIFRPPPIQDRPGWERVADMPARRGEMKAATLDGQIYVPGGLHGLGSSTDRLDVYDPERDAWETRTPMPTPLNHHGTAALDGQLFVVGGNESFFDPPGDFVYVYDPDEDAWSELPSLPDGRWGHEALVHDGKLYVVGGKTDEDDRIDTLVYDPTAESWERQAPLPTKREHVAGTVLEDHLLVISGRWDDDNTDAVAAYDPTADEWSNQPPIPTARSGFGAATIDGQLYTVGGEDPSFIGGWTTGRHERYDPGRESWERLPTAPVQVHGNAVVAVEDRLYVIGGAWRQGALSVTSWSARAFVFDPEEVDS